MWKGGSEEPEGKGGTMVGISKGKDWGLVLGALLATWGVDCAVAATPSPPWDPVSFRILMDPVFSSARERHNISAPVPLGPIIIPYDPDGYPGLVIPPDVHIDAWAFRRQTAPNSTPYLDMVVHVDEPGDSLPNFVVQQGGTGSDGGPDLATLVGSAIQVDTGDALFTIPTSEGALFGEGWLAGQILGASGLSGLRAIDEYGQIFSSTAGSASVVIDVNGSAFTRIVISGDLQLAGGSVPFATYEMHLSTYKFSNELHGDVFIGWPQGLLGSLEMQTSQLQSAFVTTLAPAANLVALHDTATQQGFALRQRFASDDWGFDLLGLTSGSGVLEATVQSMQLDDWEKVSEFTLQLFDTVPTNWSDVAIRPTYTVEAIE